MVLTDLKFLRPSGLNHQRQFCQFPPPDKKNNQSPNPKFQINPNDPMSKSPKRILTNPFLRILVIEYWLLIGYWFLDLGYCNFIQLLKGIPNNRSSSFPSSSVLAVVTMTMFIPFTLSILS